MFICKKTITQLCRNSLNPIPIIGSFVQLNLHFVKINFPHSCREKSVWGPDWVHMKGGLSCGGETVVGMQHNNTHIIPPLLNTLYSTLNKILTKEGFYPSQNQIEMPFFLLTIENDDEISDNCSPSKGGKWIFQNFTNLKNDWERL